MKIGIDVGGSHIGLGIIDKNAKFLVKKEKDYTIQKQNMSEIVIDTIIQLINEIIQEKSIKIEDIESIGIAFPGTVSDGIVMKAENLGIENLKISELLENKFKCEVFLQNDAKCAAIAEKEFGSLKQFDDSVFLIIGTGVGGAAFLNGKLLKPKRYSGLELGHMVIQKDGEKCNCGRKGCFESYTSMKRLKKRIQNEFKLPSIDGKKIKEFIIENRENEKLNIIIDTYINYLSLGIANIVNIFEPEIISIGGSFVYYKDILLDKLILQLTQGAELYNKGAIPKIVVAELKNDAGIIGASLLDKKEYVGK